MKKGIALATMLVASFCSQATERMYGVATVGYSDAELGSTDNSGVAYSLALGHQFSSQWYVEAGYHNLIDEDDGPDALQAEGLYLAVLGKAGGRIGELYYKLGIMDVDVQGIRVAGEGDCAVDAVDAESATNCGFDEGIVAGMVGLGFDYHIGLNSMLRLEALHVRGQDDFSTSMINVGFRYNFN
ncbi:outer membrane beta-barrel protein [Aestuariibacter sp. A3R04]|uniref:outer membrane beta-barrel protein n=1 Tax=Aestuariibacter sp. A3R04 TaxID=2841571 RepID=UPI001C0901B1|nr:outer membrane beta-barrel protein [Aestuariibacter sp. A3R04]MBU3021730.1 porin family protein [Aestuariibacter sp. A3R04]